MIGKSLLDELEDMGIGLDTNKSDEDRVKWILSKIKDETVGNKNEEEILGLSDSSIDLIVESKVYGIDVKITYSEEGLIECLSRNKDITDEIKDKLPNKIEWEEEYQYIEITGYIIEEHEEIVCYRCKVMTDNGLLLETLDDELESLDTIGFSIPEYKVFKSVDKYSWGYILDDIKNTFENMYEYDEIKNPTGRLIVRVNDSDLDEDSKVEIKLDKVWEKLYTCKIRIKDISWEYTSRYVLPVIETDTGEKIKLNSFDEIAKIKIGEQYNYNRKTNTIERNDLNG